MKLIAQGRRRAGARHAPRAVRHAAAVRDRLLAEGREDHPGRRRREDAGPREADLGRHLRRREGGGGGARRAARGQDARVHREPGRAPRRRSRRRRPRGRPSSTAGRTRRTRGRSKSRRARRTCTRARCCASSSARCPTARWCRPTSATSARCRTRYLRFDRPRSMFAAMSFGNCGYAFPTIIGAKVAAPGPPGDRLRRRRRVGHELRRAADLRAREHPGHRGRVQQRPVGRREEEPRRLLREPLRRREPRQAAVVGGGRARRWAPKASAIDKLADVGPALRAAAKAQSEGKTTVLEMMVTRELGDPFRRDALALPTRHLAKYTVDRGEASADAVSTAVARCPIADRGLAMASSLALLALARSHGARHRAGLSEQADPVHRPVPAGRRHRRRRAHPRTSRWRPSSASRSSSTTAAAPRATSAPTSRRRRPPTATRSCSRCRRTRSIRSSTTSCRSTSSAISCRSASRR